MTLNKSLVCLAIASLSIPAMAAPVTTEGAGVGKHGDVIAAVTFDGGRIQAIDIRKSNENPILAGKVFTEMKDAMIKHNTADIDAVTGATVSSDALRNAVKEAAAKAGVTLAGPVALLKRAPKVPETNVYDVVVIGAGGAGFSAAITASDAGAKVVLLEKMPNVGGNSLVSGAEMAAAGNWVQKKLGIEGDSVELHYQDTMKGGDMKGDPAVVRTMVENALPAAEWCRDVIGVEFQEDNLFFFGGHSKKRSLIPKGATGLDFITKFSATAEKRGIPIITNMKAEELVRDASGRVTGVKAGKSYTFSARKGVVIATGGFAANVAMRTEANPFYGDGFKTTNMPGAMGEGITMAKNIGAQVVNMGLIQTYPMCDPNSGAIELIDDARFEGAILVNQEGKRFVEELQRRDVMSKAILEQTGKYCYAIFNGEIEKRSHAITHHQDEVEVFTKTGILHKADTIEGIADFFKIPVDNLKATIARVNEFARTGKDLDFNYRSDGASMFGTNNRFRNTWSVGIGWNLHNEAFFHAKDWFQLLKLRASVGNPGNQNFSAYQAFTTYTFNTDMTNIFGSGLVINALGNKDLAWQETINWNAGADITTWNNRLNITFDWYKKITDPLLALITTPGSMGVKSVAMNAGQQKTTGIEVTLKVSPIYRPQERINWNISLNGTHAKARYAKIGNAFSSLNEEQKASLAGTTRYYDGGSPTAIWAVRSAGIDPATGKELFIKKDGSYSFTYDTDDEVVLGDTEPKLEGVIGTTLYYKGLSVGCYFRYTLGAQIFNESVFEKVENISSDEVYNNQDKRALYNRWSATNREAQYKGISLTQTTDKSSRFVMDENTISGESFNIGYEFTQPFVKRMGLSVLNIQAIMNDLFRCSSVKSERGIDYPFARTVSFSLSATF